MSLECWTEKGDNDGEGVVRKTLCVQRARDGLLYIRTAGIFFYVSQSFYVVGASIDLMNLLT